MLQEPEAKWKPILDSKGVAIHQLDSIDKTLVVYRAEAVFVGVGIWDLFAVVATPGARPVWDKTHEEASLVEDVNELTDIWHMQSKAAWPVSYVLFFFFFFFWLRGNAHGVGASARDSVMLRTTYKSPSSVHLFGFSIDDTNLFPCIPPSTDPTVIRTQIDLQGWSIESLSPNTTQVTLLEQSDPRGWSGKGSIPQVMLGTLAGIGDFAIKHGGPPVCTRLGGAKSLASRYDVESETFRFEYQPAKARRSASSSIATSFPSSPPLLMNLKGGGGGGGGNDSGSDASSLRSVSTEGSKESIECEIRCNADQWSSSFAVVIDPPQQSISALRRHRLSPNGGGLWLTIEHDPTLLRSNGKVVITVRRGAPTQGSKTYVTVNGSKIKVDVEDLPEAKVQLLKKQKRARPTRAPLDQPPGLTVRKKSSMDMATASAALSQVSPGLGSASSTFTKVAMPFSKWYNFATETTRSALVPIPPASPLPQVGLSPVEAAVNALSQLTRMHADRDGESTTPEGWLPVSDRDGLKIEKKVVPHVSETFPVFRAGRIIEGFTAEEVSSAASSLKANERFEKPVVLEEYGHGIKTAHVVAHTTFPFRGRSLLVSSIVARMADPPPPSPSMHGPQTPLSTIFHARTSNFDASITNLDPSKYNPTSLPPGNIILEGWIFETIDPYSHEQYAIPSTRCMYIASVDYSCSMPLSVNNMLNSSLPRSLLAIEGLLKNEGPPCRARDPDMAVLAPEEKDRIAGKKIIWGLKTVEEARLGVQEINDDSEYSLTVTIHPSAAATPSFSRSETLSPILKHNDSRTSVNSRSTVIDLGEEIRKGKKDLVVMEVEVGSRAVTNGCIIELTAVSLPVALHSSLSPDSPAGTITDPSAVLDGGARDAASIGTLPLTLPSTTIDLPFRPTIISLAPSVLQTASLDPSSPARHLLRVTLPTSGYDAPINDPLTGPGTPLPRPRWLLDLINDGAVVQLKLKTAPETESLPMGAGTDGEGKDENGLARASYMYQGEEIAVQDEKRGKHQGLRDATRQNLPQIVSLPLSTGGNETDAGGMKGVRDLDKPLAVQQEFLKEGVKLANVEEKKEKGGDEVEGERPVEAQVNTIFFFVQSTYYRGFLLTLCDVAGLITCTSTGSCRTAAVLL